MQAKGFRATATWLIAIGLVLVGGANGSATFADITFTVSFTNTANANLTDQEKQLFQDGVDFWDDIIIGHQDGVDRTWNLEVDTFNQAASGGGVLLGSAGPTSAIFTAAAGSQRGDGRFAISLGGQADFNLHDDAGPLSADTIRHEIGHALGFGTLWTSNNVYTTDTGRYVGNFGLAAFRDEFVGQSSATFVPVELSGGGGTANGHWDEENDFGQTLTGLVTHQGRDMRDELMTGFAAPSGSTEFLSNTTRESLRDIGFTVVPAVPEPSSMLVLLGVVAAVSVKRRR